MIRLGLPKQARTAGCGATSTRGFTLLEVMVATVVMAIAVVGLLSSLSASLRNAARLTEYDRAALMARRKMDELMATSRLPRLVELQGPLDGMAGGWMARVTPAELPPVKTPGAPMLERIELNIWWSNGDQRRNFTLESYRVAPVQPGDVGLGR